MNIVYVGLENKLSIVSKLVDSSRMMVSCNVGTLKFEKGFYVLCLTKFDANDKRIAVIRIHDHSKYGNPVVDSALFRIKSLPLPVAQIGSLTSNGIYKIGEVAIQNTLYAYIDGFAFDGVKYTITSYQLSIFDSYNEKISSALVKGNSLAELRNHLIHIKENVRIEINQIKSALISSNLMPTDTPILEPITYYINYDGNLKHIDEFNQLGKPRYFSKSSNYSPSNKDKILTEYFRVIGKDTAVTAMRWDSAGILKHYEKRNPDSSNIELLVRKNNNSSFFICYFKNNRIVAQGVAKNYQLEVFPVRYYSNMTYLSEKDSILHFLEEQYLMIDGVWMFYNDKRELSSMKLNYELIDNRRVKIFIDKY